jgi:hypothetical protein
MSLPSRNPALRSALALALLASCTLPASAHAVPSLGFIDQEPIRNDLIGALQGTVKFAQTHTIDAAHNAANELPSLVAERDALVMFIPETDIAEADMGQVKVTALRNGEVLGQRLLAPPRLLPASDRSAPDSRPNVEYSLKAWSAELPWDWMKPGLALRFSHQQRSGLLSEQALEFTGPAELVLQNIRIGMLTEPRPASSNWLETQAGLAAIDYFQKIPVARLTVGQYAPVHLPQVVLPNGTVYTTASADTGTVYNGDMRHQVGRAIASGINMANVGIVDSGGSSLAYPGYFRQALVLQSVGRYANGVVRHGLSAGNGIASLLTTTGNEFSHEVGHLFGLDHYPGGGQWASHHGHSGWGYDAFHNRMLGNVRWSAGSGDNIVEGVGTAPFQGMYRYRNDPMGGGEPDGRVSKLTHHTGYSARRVQQAMVESSQIDASSPTGYSHWNSVTQAVETTPGRTRPTHFGVPVVTLMGLYDPQGTLPTTLYEPLYGSYGHTYDLARPAASSGCYLNIWMHADAGESPRQLDIPLAARRHNVNEMNKFHINVPASSQPGLMNVYCTLDGERRKLAELGFDAPSQALPAAIQVGKADGFRQAALQIPDIRATVTGRFASTDGLEQRLRDIYGDLQQWSTARTGKVGALYVYQNPYSGLREYFMLKQARYGYFPTDGSSNSAWRYLGRAEDHVTWSPEPLRARATVGGSLTEKLLAYYGVKSVKNWEKNDLSVKRGHIYQYQNPSTKTHEFFMAKASSYGFFPTDSRSNKDWIYLGNAESLHSVFAPSDAAAVERQLNAWHQQSGLREWGVPARSGVVGEVYRYPYQRRVDYFRLRTEGYWYFPTNKTSNAEWEYLGSWE